MIEGTPEMGIYKSNIFRIMAWSLSAILFCAGCAGLGKRLETPRVHLADIRVLELKVLETVFQVKMRIFNTNDIPLKLKGIDCELHVNGTLLARGVSGEETLIPAHGTSIVSIKAYSSVINVVRGVLGLQDKDKLEYRLKGNLRIQGGYMMPSRLPFESKGELSIEGLSPGP